MSAKERVGRLQLLLERVQERAAGPRGNGAARAQAMAAPAKTAPPAAGYGESDEELESAYADKTDHTMTAPPPTPMVNTPSEHPTFPSDHPAELAPVTVAGSEQSYDIDTDSDVEVSSEVVEVDIDIDEPIPMESGAQPVAYQTTPPDELEEAEDQPMQTQPSNRPPLDETQEMRASEPDVSVSASPANEIEEPSPSSSRRPIAGEEAQAGTYEDESAPRHTPPPESGKQVAVAPSVHPKPSAPPPSLEGHTLVGGWREPGLGGPQIGAPGMGVRVPPPPGQAAHDAAAFAAAAPPHAAPPAAAPPQASGPRLTADVTRPAPSVAGAKVASFQNPAPVPKPVTLGDLLDLTLSL